MFSIAPMVALVVLLPMAATAAPLTCAQVRNGACVVADTFSLEFDGMGNPLAVMNFGLFSTSPTQGRFQALCEESFGGRTPENISVAGSKILIPSRQGVFINASEDLCNWNLAKGLPADGYVYQTVTDPLLQTRVWALVGTGGVRQLYVSEDQGASFVLRHQFVKDEVWWRLAVLASAPRKLYVSGPGLIGPFALAISNDDGQSFSNVDPVPDLADRARNSKLETVSDETPPRLYFSRDTPLGSDEVWVSQDDGKNVTRSLALPAGHFLGGFAFGATQNVLYVGSRSALTTGKSGDGALFKSTDGGQSWAAPVLSSELGPRFRCLKIREGVLYACGGGVDSGDSSYVSQSTDGILWTPIITMRQLDAPPDCVRHRCPDSTAWLCSSYGVCPPASPDAGSVDSGTISSDASSGCSCEVGAKRGTASGWRFTAIFALNLGLLWRRKRRRLRA